MTEKINPETIYKEVVAERNAKVATEAARLIAINIERVRTEETNSIKLEVQSQLVSEIKSAGPRTAEILRAEDRAYDGNTVRPVTKHYKKEKNPRPIFGRKYEAGTYTDNVAEKPVWFITSNIWSRSYQVDIASVRDECTEYVNYSESNGKGLCLDDNGIIYAYEWSVGPELVSRTLSKTKPMEVTLSMPSDEDFIPLHKINESASNSGALLNEWHDNFKNILSNNRSNPSR